VDNLLIANDVENHLAEKTLLKDMKSNTVKIKNTSVNTVRGNSTVKTNLMNIKSFASMKNFTKKNSEKERMIAMSTMNHRLNNRDEAQKPVNWKPTISTKMKSHVKKIPLYRMV